MQKRKQVLVAVFAAVMTFLWAVSLGGCQMVAGAGRDITHVANWTERQFDRLGGERSSEPTSRELGELEMHAEVVN